MKKRMIRRISTIENVGQYESFKSEIDLENNVALFGFNGAGKSTLSDILYSLANEGKDDCIIKRRTLNREGEVVEKRIKVEIGTDSGESYTFSENGWSSRPKNMYVYNGQYIDEHVFVSKRLDGNVATIGMGADGTRLLKQREQFCDENALLLSSINEGISNLAKADLKIKDFTASKITEKTTLKKLEKIANYALYPVGEENKILSKIKDSQKYAVEETTIEWCREKYESIENVDQFDISEVFKKIKRVPRVSSKEIANFLSQTLTTADIQWAVRGYKNQKDKDKCPMCGQVISDKRAVELFTKLGKYVSQNRGNYVTTFSKELHDLASKIQNVGISDRIDVFVQIVQNLDKANLLLRRDSNKFEKGLKWTSDHTKTIDSIIGKIIEKAENPYVEIIISEDEDNALRLLNAVIKNIKVLGEILNDAEVRLRKRIDKSISLDDMGKLYKLSYDASGIYRGYAETIKSSASKYIRNLEKIQELNIKIDDCYNQSRLNQVNDFLQKLNTHLRIEVKNNRYFIRLKKYIPKELDNPRDMLFSEGESKAIAFAYFLAEISSIENPERDRIIIIDDPISSMDHSRQSITSHQVADMMNNPEWQVLLMTHDISFLERVESYLDNKSFSQKLELRAEKSDFLPFEISDYLTDDETVYKNFIKAAEDSSNEIDRIIALMSMRPFAYVKKVADVDYMRIEKASTYFSHTLYCKSNRISYKSSNYNNVRIKQYIRKINRSTKSHFDVEAIAENYAFPGFDFNYLMNLYTSLPLDCIGNMRKKMLLMRPLIEACVFQFSSKNKFDAEHIGKMISSTIRANSSDKVRRKMCVELKELYDATKKYHHGADGGSLLGISWINPNEVEYFDKIIMSIVNEIRDNHMVRTIVA